MCEAGGNRFDAAVLDGIVSVLGSQSWLINKSNLDQLSRVLVAGLNNRKPALRVLYKSQSKMLPVIY